MHRFAAALVLAALVLTGCGDDGGDDDSTATTEADAATDATDGDPAEGDGTEGDGTEGDGTDPGSGDGAEVPADGECPFVPTAALDEAFGSSFEVAAASDTGCGFQDDAGLTITVSRVDILVDPETYAEEATASCDEGTLIEVEAGDRAYACTAIGPFAAYYEGDVSISFGAIGVDDEQAVVEGLAAVLPSVSVP